MFRQYDYVVPLEGKPYEKVPGVVQKVIFKPFQGFAIIVVNLFNATMYYRPEELTFWTHSSPKLNDIKEEIQRIEKLQQKKNDS